jgi:hypothetical protein
VHADILREARDLGPAGPGQLFPGAIVLAENGDDLRVEAHAGVRHDGLHGFVQRQRAAVLAIGGEGVEAVDDREDARPEGDLLAREPIGIAGAVPLLVM